MGTVNYKIGIAARNEKKFELHYDAFVHEDLSGRLRLASTSWPAPVVNAGEDPRPEQVVAAVKRWRERGNLNPDGKEGTLPHQVDASLKLWEEMEDLKPTGVNAAGEKTKVIGDSTWTIVNPKDQTIIDIGKFALAKSNKLAFVEVTSGLKLNILDFNFYALLIRTSGGVHKALVFEAPFGYKKLPF